MLSVDTRGGAIALFVVALLLLGALFRSVKYASHIPVVRTVFVLRFIKGSTTRSSCYADQCVHTAVLVQDDTF